MPFEATPRYFFSFYVPGAFRVRAISCVAQTVCVRGVVSHAKKKRRFRARRYEAERHASDGARTQPALPDEALLLATLSELDGDLVRFRDYLQAFDLDEAVVGRLLDTSRACAGRLYDLREELARVA